MVLKLFVKNVEEKYKLKNIISLSEIPIIEGMSAELNFCKCEDPIKEYSEEGCYCCWSCKKCGKFGGCDNMYYYTSMTIRGELNE